MCAREVFFLPDVPRGGFFLFPFGTAGLELTMRYIIGIAFGLFVVALVGKAVHGAKAARDLADHQVSCTVSVLAYARGNTASIDARVDAAASGVSPVDSCSK
ncbi:hypothetical protein RhoFW510R10_11690 [Rhodanobacter sp. FW510-R10]|nr:hypothetical protein RhoFW510R10_11690 [Rhodanobacter sp. FW510-R10]